MQDGQLLRRYVEAGSEAAFSQIVKRHLNLVYAVCRRETEDAALAEDITQVVFLLLARKAPALRRESTLAGWLFQTARLACKNALRQERRRRQREQKAAENMSQDLTPDNALWNELEPFVNQALAALNPTERDAVLLRVLEGCSLAETGALLGLSEEAARKRVARALEKVRCRLAKQGVVATSAALAALLPRHAVQAAPPTCANVLAPGLLAPRVSTLMQGALKAMWIMKANIAATLFAVMLAVTGLSSLVSRLHRHHPRPQPAVILPAPAPPPVRIASATPQPIRSKPAPSKLTAPRLIPPKPLPAAKLPTPARPVPPLALPQRPAAKAAFVVPRYAVTELGTLPGYEGAVAADLNNKGQVVGFAFAGENANYQMHGFLWGNGAMRDLGTLPGQPFSEARGINDWGQIVGHSGLGRFDGHVVFWEGGKPQDLGAGTATDINNAGQISGSTASNWGAAFLQQNGMRFPLGLPHDCTESQTTHINNKGAIIGLFVLAAGRNHGFIFQNSKMRDLGFLPGYPNCGAGGINDKGEIVGSVFNDDGVEHPFLWRSGQMAALAERPGELQARADAINNHGLIVGWSGGVGEAFQRATLWAGGKVYDLNDLALPGAHGTLGSARAINDRGQIIINSMDKDGRHAYLLTPVRIKSNATPSLPSLPQSLHIVYSMTQTYTSDKSTWTIPAELWLAAPNCARWTIYGKFTESRLTDGAQWTALSIDPAHPDKPILRTEPANSWRNDETSAYGPGVIAGEIPFLGFRQPGKVYQSKESRAVKTPTGWQEHCRVPHGYARLSGSGKPALVDALLTYDRQGRLVRFQRDLRSPGTYFENYDYGDFAKLAAGADIPRMVTFSQRFRDAPDKPAVTEYQTVYRVKSVETKPIPPEMFTEKNPTRPSATLPHKNGDGPVKLGSASSPVSPELGARGLPRPAPAY